MGAIQDGNIPAFQSFTLTLAGGTVTALNVYLTERSWIGITRLTFPASAADAGSLRAVPATLPTGVDGYQNPLTIESTDAQDAGELSVIVITDISKMGSSFPVVP